MGANERLDQCPYEWLRFECVKPERSKTICLDCIFERMMKALDEEAMAQATHMVDVLRRFVEGRPCAVFKADD